MGEVPLGSDRDEVAAQAPIAGLTSLSPTLIAKANLFTLSYLYPATVPGWTHTERWRPSADDEAERLRKEERDGAAQTENGAGNKYTWRWRGRSGAGHGIKDKEQQKEGVRIKVKSFIFGAARVTKE